MCPCSCQECLIFSSHQMSDAGWQVCEDDHKFLEWNRELSFRILTIAAGLHNSAIHQYSAFTCLQRITILPYFVSQIWFPTMIQHKKHWLTDSKKRKNIKQIKYSSPWWSLIRWWSLIITWSSSSSSNQFVSLSLQVYQCWQPRLNYRNKKWWEIFSRSRHGFAVVVY